MSEFSPCIIIPTYNNPATIRGVVERLLADVPGVPIIVVDDHSAPEGQKAVEELAAEGKVESYRNPQNMGKGGAMKSGFRLAAQKGYTHALQIDGDGQHCFEDVPRFLEVARRYPQAFVMGHPVFDASAPKSRLIGRNISIFWTTLETGFKRLIVDPLFGFRVYPVQAALESGTVTNRMEFDPEIAVRLAWSGLPILNLPSRVRYLEASQGGTSSFRPFKDNFMMSIMHTRLVCTLLGRMFLSLFGKRRPAMSRIDLPPGDPLLLPRGSDAGSSLPQSQTPSSADDAKSGEAESSNV